MPGRLSVPRPAVMNFTDTTELINAAIGRIELVCRQIETRMRDHEQWHTRQIEEQLQANRAMPSKWLGLGAAVMSAVAATLVGWATFHPHATTVCIQSTPPGQTVHLKCSPGP